MIRTLAMAGIALIGAGCDGDPVADKPGAAVAVHAAVDGALL